MFQAIDLLTVAALVLVGIGNLSSLFSTPFIFKPVVFRFFGVLFCVLASVAELNLLHVLAEVKANENWIFRCMFYSFIGCITFGSDADQWKGVKKDNEVGLGDLLLIQTTI